MHTQAPLRSKIPRCSEIDQSSRAYQQIREGHPLCESILRWGSVQDNQICLAALYDTRGVWLHATNTLKHMHSLALNIHSISHTRRMDLHRLNSLTQIHTRKECDFARRLLFSVAMGAMIGWERRQAERAAGIRTMGLVSLGLGNTMTHAHTNGRFTLFSHLLPYTGSTRACHARVLYVRVRWYITLLRPHHTHSLNRAAMFTLCSTNAFLSGPMAWDASRVSAAIPRWNNLFQNPTLCS